MSMSELICQAIDSLDCIEFIYDGDRRIVEPHLVGYNQTEALTLSGWQTYGRSGIGWRAFHFEKIGSLVLAGEKFEGPRTGFNPNDKTMASIVHGLS